MVATTFFYVVRLEASGLALDTLHIFPVFFQKKKAKRKRHKDDNITPEPYTTAIFFLARGVD